MANTGYIDVHSTLTGCEKRAASDFIESLGLRNYSNPGAPRPSFLAEVVKSLYNSTQAIVNSTTDALSQKEVKESLEVGGFLQEEAVQLLSIHGTNVWGNAREHLLNAVLDSTTLYPRDLRVGHEPDEKRIVFLLRCWMARRAHKKAGALARAQLRLENAEDDSAELTMFGEWPSPPLVQGFLKTEPTLVDTPAPLFPLHGANPAPAASTYPDNRALEGSEHPRWATRPESHDETDSVISSGTEPDLQRSMNRKRVNNESQQEPMKRLCKVPEQLERPGKAARDPQPPSTSPSGRVHSDLFVEVKEPVVPTASCVKTGSSTQEARTANMRIQSLSPGGTQTRLSELPVLSFERTQFLRRKILSKLLQILRSNTPSMDVIDGFDLMVNGIWTANIKAHMVQGGRLPALKQAFYHWIDMHTHLFAFRKATGYIGSSGGAWLAHVHSLTGWHNESLAIEAFNVMGTWKWDMIDKGTWVEEQLLNRDLAIFFARLVDVPECPFDFIMRGLSTYNKQLLVWFE